VKKCRVEHVSGEILHDRLFIFLISRKISLLVIKISPGGALFSRCSFLVRSLLGKDEHASQERSCVMGLSIGSVSPSQIGAMRERFQELQSGKVNVSKDELETRLTTVFRFDAQPGGARAATG
jgi:hypothetical protein